MEIVWALLIGFVTGLFIAVGSAVILKKTFKLMDSNAVEADADKNLNWSLGQAFGLATLWAAKMITACFILYFAQKAGFSIKGLGIGIPIGIILGVLAVNRKPPV